MKKLILSPMLVLFAALTITAQSVSIENILKPSRTSRGVIKEGSEVKGYYLFWMSDQVDKNTFEWTLRICDANLKTLKEIKIEDSKRVKILESSFNGTDLILLLHNDKERTFDYQVYGADGKKKHNYTRELTKKEERYLDAYNAQGDDDDNYKGLYPIEGKGFISNMPSREDRDYTFQIDYFSTEKMKQWTFTPTEGGKKFVGDYLGTFNSVVYIEELRFTGKFDSKPDSYIIGLDLETGKQLFEKPTDSKYRFYPASMSTLVDGKAYIYGEYFDLNDNIAKDKSLGFAFWGVDEKGKILSEKYNSWSLELGKYLDVNSKGKIEDFGFMYLHNIVQTADGNIFAIGEGFKKVASALGIASKLLTRNSGISAIKIKITDMMLIKFDQGFNIKEAKIYDKNSNNVELESGMEFTSTPLLGKMLKYQYPRFDYAYTQMNSERSSFSVYYSDYVRGKDYKGGTFNSITYSDGKVTTDKVNTKSDATWSFILPSKQGSVLIIEISRKNKTIEGHIEKMN